MFRRGINSLLKSKTKLITTTTSSSSLVSKNIYSISKCFESGVPTFKVEDVYHLFHKWEPNFKTKDRSMEQYFEMDKKFSKVVLYTRGKLMNKDDEENVQLYINVREAHVLLYARDATRHPDVLDILEREGGSRELPQLWVQGKRVGTGRELQDTDRFRELTAPERRSWPREGSYMQGFPGYDGITRSDQCMVRSLEAQRRKDAGEDYSNWRDSTW